MVKKTPDEAIKIAGQWKADVNERLADLSDDNYSLRNRIAEAQERLDHQKVVIFLAMILASIALIVSFCK